MKNAKRKNLILTIVLSMVAVGALVFGWIMLSNHYFSRADGHIEIKLIDLYGSTKSDKKIDFKKGDTLIYLVENNYNNVVIENGMLMSIETLITPLDWSTFICIYVDNEMSQVGISDIEFTDGTLISFVMTGFDY